MRSTGALNRCSSRTESARPALERVLPRIFLAPRIGATIWQAALLSQQTVETSHLQLPRQISLRYQAEHGMVDLATRDYNGVWR